MPRGRRRRGHRAGRARRERRRGQAGDAGRARDSTRSYRARVGRVGRAAEQHPAEPDALTPRRSKSSSHAPSSASYCRDPGRVPPSRTHTSAYAGRIEPLALDDPRVQRHGRSVDPAPHAVEPRRVAARSPSCRAGWRRRRRRGARRPSHDGRHQRIALEAAVAVLVHRHALGARGDHEGRVRGDPLEHARPPRVRTGCPGGSRCPRPRSAPRSAR